MNRSIPTLLVTAALLAFGGLSQAATPAPAAAASASNAQAPVTPAAKKRVKKHSNTRSHKTAAKSSAKPAQPASAAQ